jgi:hypothetical protein
MSCLNFSRATHAAARVWQLPCVVIIIMCAIRIPPVWTLPQVPPLVHIQYCENAVRWERRATASSLPPQAKTQYGSTATRRTCTAARPCAHACALTNQCNAKVAGRGTRAPPPSPGCRVGHRAHPVALSWPGPSCRGCSRRMVITRRSWRAAAS